jgi:hypothetical protein
MHGIIFNSMTDSFTTLDDPNGIGTTLFNGINKSGDIVGFYMDAAGNTDGLLATVPEPATWAMMLAGFVGLGSVTLHRRRKSDIATTRVSA